MIVLYVVGIAIAWVVGPKRAKASSSALRVVAAAAVIDQARRGSARRRLRSAA
jgi:hypothetical protein